MLDTSSASGVAGGSATPLFTPLQCALAGQILGNPLLILPLLLVPHQMYCAVLFWDVYLPVLRLLRHFSLQMHWTQLLQTIGSPKQTMIIRYGVLDMHPYQNKNHSALLCSYGIVSVFMLG